MRFRRDGLAVLQGRVLHCGAQAHLITAVHVVELRRQACNVESVRNRTANTVHTPRDRWGSDSRENHKADAHLVHGRGVIQWRTFCACRSEADVLPGFCVPAEPPRKHITTG